MSIESANDLIICAPFPVPEEANTRFKTTSVQKAELVHTTILYPFGNWMDVGARVYFKPEIQNTLAAKQIFEMEGKRVIILNYKDVVAQARLASSEEEPQCLNGCG